MGTISTVHKFSGGRLVSGPSDLNDPANDCGGTRLGNVQNCSVTITPRMDPIEGEEFGGAPLDFVLLDPEVIFKATFSTWDEDAVAASFYGASVGSGVPLWSAGEAHVGALSSSIRELSLLWLPNNEAASPALRIYRAMPWKIGKPVYFSGRKPLVLEVSFVCTRNSAGRVARADLLGSGNL